MCGCARVGVGCARLRAWAPACVNSVCNCDGSRVYHSKGKRDKQIENDLKEQEKERLREEGLRARVSIANA